MNKEQLYANLTMFANQFMNRGMKADEAAKQAEEVVQKLLDASDRLIKILDK